MEEARSSAAALGDDIRVRVWPRVDFLRIFGRGAAVNVIKPRDPSYPYPAVRHRNFFH